MLDYSIAKQLKDAGFQQVWPSGRGEMYVGEYEAPGQREGLYIPTLSELIEACGDGFGGLLKQDGYFITGESGDGFVNTERGKTPEEAVAKLWLSLNQTND